MTPSELRAEATALGLDIRIASDGAMLVTGLSPKGMRLVAVARGCELVSAEGAGWIEETFYCSSQLGHGEFTDEHARELLRWAAGQAERPLGFDD